MKFPDAFRNIDRYWDRLQKSAIVSVFKKIITLVSIITSSPDRRRSCEPVGG